ncbi:MAG TPA: winged helix-turn-helix domain-containing protein [Rhodanobacteraceae bacterium]|nr:winged helix-turn-helix domain-containing protein [Rhodanobacteraceae bacterium]
MSATSRPASVEPVRLAAEADFVLGDLAIHPSVREVVRGGERHQVEPRVMQVLVALARANGAVVSRDELISRCWDGRVVGEAAINRCIFKLRELAVAGEGGASFQIETIARVGYRLEAVDRAGHPLPPVAATAPAPSRAPYAIGALVAALVLAAAGWFMLRGKPSVAPTVAPAETSIAVLPFKNLSSEPDTAYFAAGIQDEILTRLAKIGSLKVISRTSAEQVATKPATLKEMAHALGVANIVEGSVQRGGDTVRVNVQLIRVDTDQHLWAEDYDRKLDDVLSVENDIAGAIATALAGKITPTESAAIAIQPTLDRRAYDLYLRGLELQRKGDSASNLEAVRVLGQAVAIDPSFAIAWALLARTEAYLAFGSDMHADHGAAAHAALGKAVALSRDLAEVQLADATLKYYVDRDYVGAERAFKSVHARWPNNADALRSLGLIERRLGHWAESVAYLREGITLDPLVLENYKILALTLSFRRDFAGVIAADDNALAIWPGNSQLMLQKIDALQSIGALDRADGLIGELDVPASDGDSVWARRVQYAYRRQFREGQRYFEGVHATPELASRAPLERAIVEVVLADFRAHNGDAEGARRGYEAGLELMLPVLKESPDDTDVIAPVAVAYAGLGDRAAATQCADRIVALFPLGQDPLDGFQSEHTRAVILARLGERDAAIASLERLMKESGPLTTTMLKLEPDFDALRGDARFERLLVEETPVRKD